MQKTLTQCVSPCSEISPRKRIPTEMPLIAVKFGWYFRITKPAQENSNTQAISALLYSLSSLPIWSPYFLQPWHSEWLCNSFPGTLAFLDTQKEQKGMKHLSQHPGKTPFNVKEGILSFWMINLQFCDSQYHKISQCKATPKPDPALSSALSLLLLGFSWADPTPESNRMQLSFSPRCVFCQVCKMNRLTEKLDEPHSWFKVSRGPACQA